MRKVVLAALAAMTAAIPATSRAQDANSRPLVRDAPQPLPEISLRAPNAGVDWDQSASGAGIGRAPPIAPTPVPVPRIAYAPLSPAKMLDAPVVDTSAPRGLDARETAFEPPAMSAGDRDVRAVDLPASRFAVADDMGFGPGSNAGVEAGVGAGAAFNRYPAYRAIALGGSLPRYWSGTAYAIGDHARHGLGQPLSGDRWVRYYDDALLVDPAGRVVDARYAMDFDRYGARWGRDNRGVPVALGGSADPNAAWSNRGERTASDLDYDRDYPYDYPYAQPRGRAFEQAGRDGDAGERYASEVYADGDVRDGYADARSIDTDGYADRRREDGRGGVGGYTVVETITTTTTPTVVRRVIYDD